MKEIKKKAEKALQAVAVVSRDRAMQTEEFKNLFLYHEELCCDEFDSHTRMLWARLSSVATNLRKCGSSGATFNMLEQATQLTQSDVRQCIRVIINLGGEIEVLSDEVSGDLIFVLHN